ncbi:uncharacterized protein [Nicotiana tomentosiformis]|uniref:uncharacterized protein n=1 Tax=Nicotiana tomentosiformis TaxID=4098 RepID=UPI00388C5DAC
MRDAIQLLTRLVAAQARRQEVGISHADRAISVRIHDIINLDPPIFTGADPNEDLQVFIDRLQRTLRVMKATTTKSVELTSYRLRDVVVNWYEFWELSKGEDAPPAVWQEFREAFIRHYLPPELRHARVDRFLTLRQGNMSVREYSLQLDSLARYTLTIVANMEDRVHRFVMGLEPHLLNDCMSVSLQPGIDISRIQAYAQGVEERHVMRDCPMRGGAGIAQTARYVASSSSSVRPPGQGSQAPAGRGRGRSGASSSNGPQNCFTLSYVTLLVASKFGIELELIKPFEIKDGPVPVSREPILKWKGNIASPRAFLGHIILGEGIRVDTQKIEAVKTWPIPMTPMEVHCFLGLAGYYKRFVEGFSSLSAPLTKLTQKATKFQWTDTCERSFQALKERLIAAPPEKSEITREIHQLANLGVQLLDSCGTRVTIQDTTTSSLVTKVKERQYEDPVLAHYRDITLQKEKTPFEITGDGILRYRGRLCVPNMAGLHQQVMGEAHYSCYSIHPGETKMYHDIRGIYWWDGMKKDITELVA